MPLVFDTPDWNSPHCQFGLGAFESMRAIETNIPLWSWHKKRLTQALITWNIDIKLMEEIEAYLFEQLKVGPWRVKLLLGLAENGDCHIHVYMQSLSIDKHPRKLMLTDGAPYLLPYKSTSYDVHYLNRQKALAASFDDVLYCSGEFLLECSTACIMSVNERQGRIVCKGALPSVSAQVLFDRSNGFWAPAELNWKNLGDQDCLWMGNAVQGLIPVERICDENGSKLYEAKDLRLSMLEDWDQQIFPE